MKCSLIHSMDQPVEIWHGDELYFYGFRDVYLIGGKFKVYLNEDDMTESNDVIYNIEDQVWRG